MNITDQVNQDNLNALDKLHMPSYRIVDDVTPDEQLGKYSPHLWKRVEADITLAIDENSQVYFECEAKVFRSAWRDEAIKENINPEEIPF